MVLHLEVRGELQKRRRIIVRETGTADGRSSRAPQDGQRRESVSRRQFLRLAGAAGLAVGSAGALGGILVACGDEQTTTSEVAGATTPTTSGPVTSAVASTSTSSGPELGREVKIGIVSPQTGPMATFGAADNWSMRITQEALGEGRLLGDGKFHKIVFEVRDTQSDTNRAAQVAGELATSAKADLLISSGGPDTIMPAADQAETLGVPFISNNCPWQAFVFGRGGAIDTEFKYTFSHAFGIEQAAQALLGAMDQIPTNKKAGFLFPNTADTEAWMAEGTGVKDAFEAAGYTTVVPSLYQPGSEDFTAEIARYKKEACEIHMGSNATADFTNFMTQASQQAYAPKMVIEVMGIQMYASIQALGELAYGCIAGLAWCKGLPYTCAVTGMTTDDLVASYEAETGELWNNFIGIHSLKAWAVDVLERTSDLDSRDAVVAAIKGTKMELISGPIDMTAGVDPSGLHVTPNVYKQPFYVAQIVPGSETGNNYDFDRLLVSVADVTGLSLHEVREKSAFV